MLEFLPFLELSAKISLVLICVSLELGLTANLSTWGGLGVGYGGFALERPVAVEEPVNFFWGGKGLGGLGWVGGWRWL